MTEARWLKCEDPTHMSSFLCRQLKFPRTTRGRRKLRLLACAYGRRIWHLLNDKKSRKAVELAERFADGLAEATELKRTWEQVSGHVVCGAVCAPVSSAVVWVSEQAAARVTRGLEGQHHSATDAMFLSERSAQADLVRDIFGNPFRPVTFSPSWRTDTAVTLARQMYESRDFGAMPILADALQDAGCDNADILTHCRCDGPLVRGCWVCDLVLGKE